MAGNSDIGRFILWLYSREANVPSTPEAQRLLDALAQGTGTPGTDPYVDAGLILRGGHVDGEIARGVARSADTRLQNVDTVLAYIEAHGYTRLALRAVLQHHYWSLKGAALGSEAHIIVTDISAAIAQLESRDKAAALLLTAGYGTQEIGKALRSNGSRRVRQAVIAIHALLETVDEESELV